MNKKILKHITLFALTFLIITTHIANTAYAQTRLNMTYLYSGTQNNYYTYINRTKDSLDVVMPNLFNIKYNSDKTSAELEVTDVIDKSFVSRMHSEGRKVIPYISNHWDRELGRMALANYKNYANALVKVIKEYNLDGVNIDIENLTEADKESLTQFTKYLRQQLPEDKELSMAVAANPTDAKTGWCGSYDYTELNKYLNRFIIMAYDESYYGSKPGPVASYSFVENSIKTMLKYTTSNKVVLGVPFYGRYWNSSKSVGGDAIINASVDKVKSAFIGRYYYDEVAKTPYIKFSVNKIQSMYTVAGKKFDEGNYTMYFEDERSIKEKLILVEKYNLLGSVSWALSQEDTKIWDNYSSWLNGIYYDDVAKSWAKTYIKDATVKGYLNGKNLYSFEPDEYMSREEYATVICRVQKYNNIIVNSSVFKDINSSRWSYDYINTVYSYGIMNGSNGYFDPKGDISREEVAATLYRILKGTPIPYVQSFTDVTQNMWSAKYIDYCTQLGILEGYEDGSFRPKHKMTRAEIAAIIVKLEKYK